MTNSQPLDGGPANANGTAYSGTRYERLAHAEDYTRDPAEEACYDIQKACWEFQRAIELADSPARLAFPDGMLAESRKRLELVIVAIGARQVEIDRGGAK